MQIYLAALMTFSGVVGFFGYINSARPDDKAIAVVALKIASALLSAVVALGLRG
jgi:hypothetical protein